MCAQHQRDDENGDEYRKGMCDSGNGGGRHHDHEERKTGNQGEDGLHGVNLSAPTDTGGRRKVVHTWCIGGLKVWI